MAIQPQSTAQILAQRASDARKQQELALLQSPQVGTPQVNLRANNPYGMMTAGLQTMVDSVGAGDRRALLQNNADRAAILQREKTGRSNLAYDQTQEDRRAGLANQQALVAAQQQGMQLTNQAELEKQNMYSQKGIDPTNPIIGQVNNLNKYYSSLAPGGDKGIVADFIEGKEYLNTDAKIQNLTQSINDAKGMVLKDREDVPPELLDFALREVLKHSEVDPEGYFSAGGDLDSTQVAKDVKNMLPNLRIANELAKEASAIDNRVQQQKAALQLQAARAAIPKF